MTDSTTNDYDIDEDLSFNVSFSRPLGIESRDGFNKYGVKEHEDGSLDVIFAAMEPGLRKGIRVTEDFLRGVSASFSGPIPMQLDHSDGQLANVGQVQDVKFSDGFLRLIGNIPNTGNTVKSDIIADFTHEPPAIHDGSVGFSNDYRIERNDAGEPEFVDATMAEFSLTPFPGGYGDEGGLSHQFTDAAREAGVFDDTDEHESPDGTSRMKGENRARIYNYNF